MATVMEVKNGQQTEKLAEAAKNGAKTLSSGLTAPEGEHLFITAERKVFGILQVESVISGKWALPMVAGTMKFTDGGSQTFELSDKPGAKILIIPDHFYITMKPSTAYMVTIETRKGRKVVTNVQLEEGDEDNIISSDKVNKAVSREPQTV